MQCFDFKFNKKIIMLPSNLSRIWSMLLGHLTWLTIKNTMTFCRIIKKCSVDAACDGTTAINRETARIIFEGLLKAMNDYSSNSRGDVGYTYV